MVKEEVRVHDIFVLARFGCGDGRGGFARLFGERGGFGEHCALHLLGRANAGAAGALVLLLNVFARLFLARLFVLDLHVALFEFHLGLDLLQLRGLVALVSVLLLQLVFELACTA